MTLVFFEGAHWLADLSIFHCALPSWIHSGEGPSFTPNARFMFIMARLQRRWKAIWVMRQNLSQYCNFTQNLAFTHPHMSHTPNMWSLYLLKPGLHWPGHVWKLWRKSADLHGEWSYIWVASLLLISHRIRRKRCLLTDGLQGIHAFLTHLASYLTSYSTRLRCWMGPMLTHYWSGDALSVPGDSLPYIVPSIRLSAVEVNIVGEN